MILVLWWDQSLAFFSVSVPKEFNRKKLS